MGKRRLLLRRKALERAESEGLIFAGPGRARLRRGAPDLVFLPVKAEIEESLAKCGSVSRAAADLQERGFLPDYADAAHLRRWIKSRKEAGLGFRHVEGRDGLRAISHAEQSEDDMKEIPNEEISRLLGLIEKSGGMKQKDGRLSPGVLHLVLEPKREKVSDLLAVVKTYRQAYNILKVQGDLPDFITYFQFRLYFARHNSSGRALSSRTSLGSGGGPCDEGKKA